MGFSECPCGSGTAYAACCGRFHDGEPAPTAEALMRSRYSAYVLGLEDYLFRTWHPRTRPELTLDGSTEWLGLEILGSTETTVEFRARYAGGVLHEKSRFERRAGRWVYVDGDVGSGE